MKLQRCCKQAARMLQVCCKDVAMQEIDSTQSIDTQLVRRRMLQGCCNNAVKSVACCLLAVAWCLLSFACCPLPRMCNYAIITIPLPSMCNYVINYVYCYVSAQLISALQLIRGGGVN